MTLPRRGLLAGAAAALLLGTGAAAATAASLPLLPGTRRWIVRRVIERHVPGIAFEGEDLARFTAEVERLQLNRHRMGLRGMAHYGGVALLQDWPAARGLLERLAPTAEVDRRIVNAFFRATDFWEGPYRPGRRIAMVRSPDPYESRCSNPLAVVA
jgi:hypothetical protein